MDVAIANDICNRIADAGYVLSGAVECLSIPPSEPEAAQRLMREAYAQLASATAELKTMAYPSGQA